MLALKNEYRKNFKAILTKIKLSKNIKYKDYKIACFLNQILDAEIKILKKHQKSSISILFYYPLPIEFDSRKLLNLYRKKRNVQIFLPFMHDDSFKIAKYRLPLQKTSFGLYEPSCSSYKIPKIHLAVIPVIGMDKNFKRIGFGKGMYDKFFSTLKIQPKSIFVCRAMNYTPIVITQKHDIKAHYFITPFALLKSKKNHDKLRYYKFDSFCTSC